MKSPFGHQSSAGAAGAVGATGAGAAGGSWVAGAAWVSGTATTGASAVVAAATGAGAVTASAGVFPLETATVDVVDAVLGGVTLADGVARGRAELGAVGLDGVDEFCVGVGLVVTVFGHHTIAATTPVTSRVPAMNRATSRRRWGAVGWPSPAGMRMLTGNLQREWG